VSGVATGLGHGKLILVGEHAVVHGQPAIAFAVDLGTQVDVRPLPGARGDGLREGPDDASSNLIRSELVDAMVERAIAASVGPSGWQVDIRSTLPLGRGMGSSAALSVALVRAGRAARGEAPLQGEALFQAALALERIFHANPSGLDVAVSVYGGALRYRRTEPITLQPLPAPAWQVVVLDTGRSGSTKELVAGVTSRRPGIDPLLTRIGEVVDAATEVLADARALGPLLDENQRLLEGIGVSTPEIEALCRLARGAGALGAKLSGAGGGGVVIALVEDPTPVLRAAAAAGVRAWPCRPPA
jgi:mevalonate kinase